MLKSLKPSSMTKLQMLEPLRKMVPPKRESAKNRRKSIKRIAKLAVFQAT
jgi:hypothetical protein